MIDSDHQNGIAAHAAQPPNGLAFSGRLEGTTLIDRECSFLRLDAKNAPIQPLRWNAVLGCPASLAQGFKAATFGFRAHDRYNS